MATKTLAYIWSFPGYKNDLTCVGIYVHEFGHYIWDKYKTLKLSGKFLSITRKEKSITSYDKNNSIHENFAETFKLFITNPDLLKSGRPLRYDFLVNDLKFVPIINNNNYLDQFRFANSRYITTIKKWL